MNECPFMIDKKWDPRYDARPALLRKVGADVDPDIIDRVLDALTDMIGTETKVSVVGVGTWEHKPLTRRTPDGKIHSVMRVYFNLADAAKRRLYGGRHLKQQESNNETK